MSRCCSNTLSYTVTHLCSALLFILLTACTASFAQGVGEYAYGDEWYTNPLGFSPIKLHTSNGFILPAIAVGAILLFTDADSAFAHHWRFYQEGGISIGYKPPLTSVFLGNVGALYQARSWMEFGGELSVYHVRDPFNDTWGVGLRPVARFYPVNTDHVRIYFESGAGLVYFVDQFPKPSASDSRLGTNLNGSPKYGLGGEIRLGDDILLLLGIRHVHVSNGNTSGVERNPSHDSNGFYIGFTYAPGE